MRTMQRKEMIEFKNKLPFLNLIELPVVGLTKFIYRSVPKISHVQRALLFCGHVTLMEQAFPFKYFLYFI